MNSELVPIASIKENPNNPRTISEDSLEKLKQSLKSFPQMLSLRPLVVNEAGLVLGGNMRLRAAKEIGLEQVPVLRAKDLRAEPIDESILKDHFAFRQWEPAASR